MVVGNGDKSTVISHGQLLPKAVFGFFKNTTLRKAMEYDTIAIMSSQVCT